MRYYLAKSNPNVYQIREALDYYRSVADVSWTICKDAKPGDILFIGQSGKEAGIYAKAIVTGDTFKAPYDFHFWLDPEEARKSAWFAPLESLVLMKHPILETALETASRAFPELKRVVKWLHSQGKVRLLSDEEGKALLRFV